MPLHLDGRVAKQARGALAATGAVDVTLVEGMVASKQQQAAW